jgi:hypothetical protein
MQTWKVAENVFLDNRVMRTKLDWSLCLDVKQEVIWLYVN